MKRHVAFAVPVLFAFALGCSGGKGESPVTAPNVSLGDATAVDMEDRIEATGELVSPNHAMIAAEVGGRVTALFIDEGKPADSGDRVMEVDPERRELELRGARAANAEAQAAMVDQKRAAERVASLFNSNVASKSQLDTAQTQLELARSRADGAAARLAEAERARRDAEVKAPFRGLIAQRFVSVGEFVSRARASSSLWRSIRSRSSSASPRSTRAACSPDRPWPCASRRFPTRSSRRR